MKKIYFLLLILLGIQFGFSQAPLNANGQNAIPYESVETQPEYPGGMAEFNKFISKNLQLPELENTGDIIISFVINEYGKVVEAKIVKDLGNGSGDAVKKVVNMLPIWKPGEVAGKPVRVSYNLPLKIR